MHNIMHLTSLIYPHRFHPRSGLFDVNSKGFYNITPLHWAVYPMNVDKIEENKKSIECIQILLNNGANKSNKVNGKTAADWAEERNLTDIVKMLKP